MSNILKLKKFIKNKWRELLFLIPFTLYYGTWLCLSAAVVFVLLLEGNKFGVIGEWYFNLMVVGGFIGMIGSWMLFMIDDFSKNNRKKYTMLMVLIGIISAVGGMTVFKNAFLEENIFFFMLSWGLLLYTVVNVVFLFGKVVYVKEK